MAARSKSRAKIAAAPPNPEGGQRSGGLARLTRWPATGAFLLAALTVLVYLPALHGGILWDDPAHMTSPDLVSVHGLSRIWFELGATQQYYPLLYTTFWLEHLAWGDATLGYHVVNVTLHIGVALLLWATLNRLKTPGGYLAALIFALHPVQVESVAWISELKNTLSTIFFLSALWWYLRFDAERDRRPYLIALGLFVLGLLTKTVIATFPAVLLVIFWWQRGKLTFRRDIRPTIPFFALGLGAGITTAWLERTMVGAHGPDFQMSLAGRLALAGRVIWFYLHSLAWPFHLAFFYPRWTIDPSEPRQWIYSATTVLLVTLLWLLRGRSRGPLAALLLFIGMLFPVLGFVNVYPFRFSYVADHFQYLPNLALVALVAAAVVSLYQRNGTTIRRTIVAISVTAVAGLGALSWHESQLFGADDVALYQATVERNPAAWPAYENWGAALLARGDPDGAIARVEQAISYNPQYAWAYYTYANALIALGRRDEAIEKFRKSIALNPELPQVQFDLANLLYQMGRLPEAVTSFEQTIELQPKLAEAHFDLGAVLFKTGQSQQAETEFDIAGDLGKNSVEMQRRLVSAYNAIGDPMRAATAADRAARLSVP